MNAVRINHEERTIVITKKFAREASKYGTPAYNELKEIKADNIGYAVVVRAVEKKVSPINNITYKTIENYIVKHDPTGEIMSDFLKLKNEVVGEKLHKTTFFQIKKWFFKTYPELKNVA